MDDQALVRSGIKVVFPGLQSAIVRINKQNPYYLEFVVDPVSRADDMRYRLVESRRWAENPAAWPGDPPARKGSMAWYTARKRAAKAILDARERHAREEEDARQGNLDL